MTNFTIDIAYEGTFKMRDMDLLTALKNAMNKEADLYADGKLVFSALGLSFEDNAETLKSYGITHYVNEQRTLCFKWTDESKNENAKVFVQFMEYEYKGKKQLEIHVCDYKSRQDDAVFNNYNELLGFTELCYTPNYADTDIQFVDFRNGCNSYTLHDHKATI